MEARWQLEPRTAATTAALGLLAALLAGQYYARLHNYWRRRGLKGERPLFGFFSELFNLFFRNRAELALQRGRKYGKLYGVFFQGAPKLVVADAEVLRQICIKDFDVFTNHRLNEWANKFQRHFLVWLQDDHWRRVRSLLSPQFTTIKMKRLFRLLDACADDLLESFREQLIAARRNEGASQARVDLFATYSLYTMDGITSCCYGLKLERHRGDLDIKQAASRNQLVRDCNAVFTFNYWRLACIALAPRWLLRAVSFRMLPESELEPLVKRMERLVALKRQGKSTGKHDDLLQMLVDAKQDGGGDEEAEEQLGEEVEAAEDHHAGVTREERRAQRSQAGDNKSNGSGGGQKAALSDLELVSEALFLMVAGLDTTRSSLSTITYLLAHNPDVQERLVRELRLIARYEETPVGKRVQFDYAELTACAYLDAVISESLRFMGPVMYTDRAVERDYYIAKYNVTVPKGSHLLLALHSVAHDPDYWREPQRFDPERFMPGQRERIVPGSYAPFSLGPRHCVGMRSSLTETKLGLAKVLLSYKFAPAPNTKYPPEPNRGVALVRVNKCHVLVSERDENEL